MLISSPNSNLDQLFKVISLIKIINNIEKNNVNIKLYYTLCQRKTHEF